MTEAARIEACTLCRRETNAAPCGGACPCPVSGKSFLAHVKARNGKGFCPHPAGPLFGTSVAPEGWMDVPAAQAGTASSPASPKPIAPVPREKWPRVVKLIAWRRREAESGAGDTLARLIPAGDAFKAFTKKHGIDCGCAERQARLNVLYPY